MALLIRIIATISVRKLPRGENLFRVSDCYTVYYIVRKSNAGDLGYISNHDFRARELGHLGDSRKLAPCERRGWDSNPGTSLTPSTA